jgi:hypothetical protein
LDVIAQRLKAKGYSEAVAKRVARAGRDTTNAVYDGKWKIYCHWCSERALDPFCPNGPQITAFLEHLFTAKGWAYSTMRGYKAAIMSVLQTGGHMTPEEERIIGALFLSFKKDRPVQPRSMPTWYLGIVLRGLKMSPFERQTFTF